MKICMISSLYPPIIFGGASGVAHLEAEELVRRGHEVSVITTSHDNNFYEERINGVRIYRIPPFNVYTFFDNFIEKELTIKKIIWQLIDRFNLFIQKHIIKILKKEKPDLIHIHNFTGFSPYVFRTVKSLKIPVIFTAHDYKIACPRATLLKGNNCVCNEERVFCSFYRKFNKLIACDPDIMISPSTFLMQILNDREIFDKSEKVILPNPLPLKPEKVKKDYETIKIMFAGELNRHKGIEVLLEVIKLLDGYKKKFYIFGRGEYEDVLKEISKNDDEVEYYGYAAGIEDLKRFYRDVNVTLVPSLWYEVFGLVIIESFANSTPVIASRIGGIPELVINGYNGFLFEPGNVLELKELLINIIENPSILERLENNAFKSSKIYTVEEHVNKLENIYKCLTEDTK
ncbi:glycosyltransferase family 4 protein [Methanothermobacter sp. KEPCO 2]|uniref:glycosyltransferase family 4 protein n=1 Tax=Methanothermobacter TaxID=145260 RepID=UPI0035151F57